MYLKPLTHKALALLGLSRRELQSAASRHWIICPPSRQTVPPAIYNPADLDRVTGTSEYSSLPEEMASLLRNVHEHAASVAFVLRNADLVEGHLYAGRWKDRLLSRRPPLLSAAPDTVLPQGSLATSWHGSTFFGHWLADDLTLQLAAERTGHPFVAERPLYVHEPEYRRLLGLPIQAYRRVRVGELVVIEDRAQNAFKRARYDELRRRLATVTQSQGHRRVFLRRGEGGRSRRLLNAPEVEQYLQAQGFEILCPEALSAADIATRMLGATLAVGVEGSHLAHALLTMAHGGVICCLQPPDRFVNIFRGYANCLDMQYATVVGHAASGGFRLDLEDLKRVLDRIDVALSHRPTCTPQVITSVRSSDSCSTSSPTNLSAARISSALRS
jgi:hypothetical protein